MQILVCVCILLALPQDVAVEDKKPAHCGTLIQAANGGSFSSPNYPNTYPPNKECVYILEGTSLASTDTCLICCFGKICIA